MAEFAAVRARIDSAIVARERGKTEVTLPREGKQPPDTAARDVEVELPAQPHALAVVHTQDERPDMSPDPADVDVERPLSRSCCHLPELRRLDARRAIGPCPRAGRVDCPADGQPRA